MIRLSILYPNTEGKNFDKDYYLNIHMPMSLQLQGEAVKSVSVEFGINGGLPDSKPAYIVMCHFLYNSFEDFQKAFMPHADTLMKDILNYTDIEATIQFSEVKMNL